MRAWLLALPVLVGLSACGSQPAAKASGRSSPPSPVSILLKIGTSGLHDAHFTLTEELPNGSGGTVEGTGEGVWVVKPPPAERYSVTLSALGVTFENIAVGDFIYYRKSTDQTWTLQRARSPLANLDYASNLTLVAEEQTAQGKAWHLSGNDITLSPFEIWIREKDSYPIKYTSNNPKAGSDLIVFDRYNTGESVLPPPASQVGQG